MFRPMSSLPPKLNARSEYMGIWPSIQCLRCFALGAFPLTLVPPCWMHSVLFVEGQEVLSVFAEFIAPVSPFLTPSRPLSYFTGCARFWRGCGLGWFLCLVLCSLFSYVAT